MSFYRKLADRLLMPAFAEASPDTLYRARLTLLFGLVGIPVAISFALFYQFVLGTDVGAAGLLVAGLMVGATPLVLRRTRSVRFAATLLTLSVYGIASFTAFLRGGLPITALIYYLLVPVIAVQLISTRAAWIWTGICSVSTISVWVLYQVGSPLESRMGMPNSELVNLDMMGVLMLIVVLAALAALHDRARVRLLRENAELQSAGEEHTRLESLGRMAGGICHDFNNQLAVILTHADIVLDELDEEDPNYDDVLSILQAGRRGARLTSQLLAFSHQRVPTPHEIVDVNHVINDLESFLTRSIGDKIQIVSSLEEDAGRVRMDRGQLEQVIINLALNARDAMEDGGTLTIETKAITDKDIANDPNAPTSNSEPKLARLTVKDTGCGISDDVKAHIFEPFYTTKRLGMGTGLGLATAYGIVKQAKGRISLDSSQGAGSTFSIDLPTTKEQVRPPTDAIPAIPAPRDRTVLLVDDERPVLEATRRILLRHGYSVLIASNGEEALEICKDSGNDIDIVLSDVVMSKMSGVELFEVIRDRYPHMLTLLTSGYPKDTQLDAAHTAEPDPILRKPFTTEELLHRLSQLLQQQAAVA